MASLRRQQLIQSLVPASISEKLDVNSDSPETFTAAVQKLPEDDAQCVKLLLELAELSQDNEAIVGALAKNSKVKSLRDAALLYNAKDLAALIPSTAQHNSPSQTTLVHTEVSQTTTPTLSAVNSPALTFCRGLFRKEPSGVLQKMIEDAELYPNDAELRNHILQFFTSNPTFDIRSKSVTTTLHQMTEANPKSKFSPIPAAAIEPLKTLQRVQALTSDPADIPVLLAAGVKSAQQVAAIPANHFVQDMGLPAENAKNIHRHATNSVIRSNMVLTNVLQTVRGSGIKMIDGTATRQERLEQAKQMVASRSSNIVSVVDLEQLFGSMDYCECSDCNDVTSPANYFVELLQYLRNNNLKPLTGTTPPTTGWAGTALEELFRRRPDLADLELTCPNTNTVLPYIDLSNEVMESFVVHLKAYINDTHTPKQASIDVFNVATDDISSELLAQPRNTNYTAYCILKDAVYPFTLPYHQPIDEMRILLGFLGTSRYELMSTFRAALPLGTPDTTDSEVALDRALTAETLLLIQEDYKILTLEAFYSLKYFATTVNMPTLSVTDYQTNIGILPPYAYWGYTDAEAADISSIDESTQVGLTFVKAQFLPRSGLAYTDVVALVQTQYVNPNWPNGWALRLLERIRFSYAYLYSLIDMSKKTQAEQLAPVIAWLVQYQPAAELFEKMRAEYLKNLSKTSSGDASEVPPNTIQGACCCNCDDECIWKCWVLKYFILFGQLVVLDSRDGAVFQTEGWLVLRQSSSRPQIAAPVPKIAVQTLEAQKIPATTPTGSTDTIEGYLARDGSITTPSDTGVVTQVGHIAPDGTVIWDATEETFVKHFALDGSTNQMLLLSIDRTTQIGDVDPGTDEVMLFDDSGESSTVVQWGPIQDSCNLDHVRLIHLDGSPISADDYGRWQRFIRLWLKLGWTMQQLDQALIGLSNITSTNGGDNGGGSGGNGGGGNDPPPPPPAVTWDDLKDKCPASECDDPSGDDDDDCECCPLHNEVNFTPHAPLNITPEFLDQLAAVKELQTTTGLDLSQLLVFWSDIGTHSGASPPLYQQLFLTTNIRAMDPIFEADPNGNYLTSSTETLSSHAPVVMAALHISKPSDLAVLVSVAKITDGVLSLSNLSAIYRYKLLATVLGITVAQLPAFLAVFGDVFSNGAKGTVRVLNEYTTANNAGFSVTQLRYIITGVDDSTRPIGPSQISILRTCKALADGLSNIRTSNPDPDPSVTITSDMVATSAGLLFGSATTSDIVAALTGSKAWTTNAPTGLKISVSDSLSKKLQYSDSPAMATTSASATVTSIGILTTDEVNAAKLIVTGANAGAWGQAIDRLLKQAISWFKSTISFIFTDQNAAMAALLIGDVPASPPASSSPGDPTAVVPPPDPGTSPGKLSYFLVNFMPFLRNTLEIQLVVDTMTGTSGLSSDLTRLLLTDILTVTGSSGSSSSALQALLGLLDEPANSLTSDWNGYLIVPSTDTYTFSAIGDTQPSSILLGTTTVSFPHQQEDPNNVWFSDPIKLKTGVLIPLSVPARPATQLKWKSNHSALASVPSSALLPAYATGAMTSAFVALFKAGLVINGSSLSLDEVSYLQTNKTDFDGFDLNAITRKSLKRVLAYANLRASIQGATNTLLDLFTWAVSTSNSGQTLGSGVLTGMITVSTAWDATPVAALIDPKGFNMVSASLFRNENALIKIQKALTVFQKVGGGGGGAGAIDVPTLFSWVHSLNKFQKLKAVAASIRKTIRAKYPVSTWSQAVQPLNNTLREDQKNALIAYLVVQPILRQQGVIDADSLFEFFLIDVQMSSCLQTSRIKQAISTVQLFIQRCLLGLELDTNQKPIRVDPDRWNWMSKYRVWQANREVFLWPENWLVPSLRDDKSEFYKTLESKLLQKNVDTAAVSAAFKNYLYDVDKAANLLVEGLFLETDQTDKLLHIVSGSRHAPREYYYRQFNITQGLWTSWETMSVDIPTYTIDATASIPGESGSYVTPVVWNGRIFVFFPQFASKSLPSAAISDSTKSMQDIGNAKPANQSQPIQYWEIRMNMSERLVDGTWTPKQLSAEAVYESLAGIDDPTKGYVRPLINSYLFIPRLQGSNDTATLSIDVLRTQSRSNNPPHHVAVGRFDFVNGRVVKSTNVVSNLEIKARDFGEDSRKNEMHSWQASTNDKNPDYYDDVPKAIYPKGYPSGIVEISWDSDILVTPTNFYHPFVHNLLGRLSTTGNLDDVFNYLASPQTLPDSQLSDAFGGNPKSTYDELSQPYAIYNWEVGYHAPMALVDQLFAQNQFDQALKLCNYIFNPLLNSNTISDCWQFRPFKDIVAKDYLENFFANLQPGVANTDITQWRDNAFSPFVVARSRPVAFMKAVAMKYIEILIAYGDYYFRQNTLETVPLAIQCYVVARHIYGQPGQKIPKRGNMETQTFRILCDRFDAFDNAVVDLELMFPFSNQIDTALPIGFTGAFDTPVNLPNIWGSATTRYFCIPQNAQLVALGAIIDDRLFKLRHCQDINGVVQHLPLFEPPLDVGLLVAATAAGLSIASVLQDLDSPMPNYRFYYLLQKAHDIVGELKSLTQAVLLAKEKSDGEALQVLRQQHEVQISKLVLEIKQKSLDDANATLTHLQASRNGPNYRLQYYLQLLGIDTSSIPADTTQQFTEIPNLIEQPSDDGGLLLIPSEAESLDKAHTAHDITIGAGVAEGLATIFHALPDTTWATTPIGVGIQIHWGFPFLANASSATSRGLQIAGGTLSAESSLAASRTGFLRNRQDRIQQANIAGYEVSTIDKQISGQQIRIDMANTEITNQQALIDNSQQVMDFLHTKFTNQELYTWLDTQTSQLCYSAYTLAYDLAKRVEKAYRFERPRDADRVFVQFGYWDPSRDGILAGDRLSSALRQIEAAYQSDRGYDYEITKAISLRQLQPLELLRLRQTGACQINVPEILFDMDFPGHYLRRIKSVSLTIPCVVGPYTSVSCSLRLSDHIYRVSPLAKSASDYPQIVDGDDNRFATTNLPISAIATSNAQNDAGVFELNFTSSERYLPFEGAGAISDWTLNLPDGLRQFDYSSITNVVLTIKYTSCEGGAQLQAAAASTVAGFIKSVDNLADTQGLFMLWDLRAEFATEWYRAKQPLAQGADPTQRMIRLANLNQTLPNFTVTVKKLTAVDIYLFSTEPLPVQALSIAPLTSGTGGGDSVTFIQGPAVRSLNVYQAIGADLKLDSWQLVIADATVTLDRIFLVVRYTMG